MRNGWEIKKLGDVCVIISRGVSPKYVDVNGLMVLNQKCIKGNKVNYELARQHDNEVKKVSKERLIQIGDVLVNSTGTGTLGRVAQVKDEIKATVDSHVTIVRPIKELFYNEFFGYAMVSIEEEIAKGGEGCGGQTELSRTKLKEEYFINYPKSLSEQIRIVALLDEAFAAIDKAKANIEKNLQNAKDLFEGYLNRGFAKKEKLGQLVNIVTGKLNANAAVENGEYAFFTCSREVFKIDKYAFDCESVLLAGNNAVGDFNVKHYKGKFNAYQRTYVITVKDETNLDYRFLYYQIEKSLADLKEQSVGAGTKFLKLPVIQAFEIAYPSIEEQKQVVQKLDALSQKTKKLQTHYQQKLTSLEELKKSLLQKAFAGELTTSTPKLYSIRSSDVSFAAEPEVAYAKPALSKQQAFLQKLMLASHIVYELCEEKTFGHTKLMKLLYLCEQVGGMALQTAYKKFAAGPFDSKTLKGIDKAFEKNGWFEIKKTKYNVNGKEREATSYKRTNKSLSYKKHFDKYFASEAVTINRLIELFKKEKTGTAEIVATLYYVWKELTATNAAATLAALISAFYEFHPEKKKFKPEEITTGYYFMINHSIYPDA